MNNNRNINNNENDKLIRFEIPIDIKKIMSTIEKVRNPKVIIKKILEIKNNSFGEKIEEYMKNYYGKELKISHNKLGNNGFLVGKYKGVNFYDSALWSLVLEIEDDKIEIVPMELLNDGIQIEILDNQIEKTINNTKNIVDNIEAVN